MFYKTSAEFMEENGYELHGFWYPRVTRILDIKSKPALEKFFEEVGSYTSAKSIKEKSAVEGSMVHEAIQKRMIGEDFALAEEIRPAVEAFEIFNEKQNIYFHPEFIERKIWSDRYKYAGTVDALAEVGGKFGVLDIKTSPSFYPEYNLQTAAYFFALQETELMQSLKLPRPVTTRWILRVDQKRKCSKCGAFLREKGGRKKIRNGRIAAVKICREEDHAWGKLTGDVEIKEFPYYQNDIRAFIAAKILWEWENSYWLKQINHGKNI